MEGEFIRWLRTRLPVHSALELGIGSHAAVVRVPSGKSVVTTDALMDGVDFHLAETDPARIGRKSLAVNLSDLAAMGARPTAVLVSLMLPKSGALELAQRLFEGILALAEQFDVAIAGGDTNTWNGPLAISITAMGEPPARGVWTRSGARSGDWLLATGAFGGSILGHHFDFVPRVNLACAVADRFDIHAATDVSDGLSLDLSHIVSESGCGVVVDLESIPISPAARQLASERPEGGSALSHALSDGEDFQLLLAVPPDEARRLLADVEWGREFAAIGRFCERRGMWGRDATGVESPLAARGYEH